MQLTSLSEDLLVLPCSGFKGPYQGTIFPFLAIYSIERKGFLCLFRLPECLPTSSLKYISILNRHASPDSVSQRYQIDKTLEPILLKITTQQKAHEFKYSYFVISRYHLRKILELVTSEINSSPILESWEWLPIAAMLVPPEYAVDYSAFVGSMISFVTAEGGDKYTRVLLDFNPRPHQRRKILQLAATPRGVTPTSNSDSSMDDLMPLSQVDVEAACEMAMPFHLRVFNPRQAYFNLRGGDFLCQARVSIVHFL